MPNWGSSGNSKASEAKERKANIKKEKLESQKKQIEDAKWADEVTEAKLSKKVCVCLINFEIKKFIKKFGLIE